MSKLPDSNGGSSAVVSLPANWPDPRAAEDGFPDDIFPLSALILTQAGIRTRENAKLPPASSFYQSVSVGYMSGTCGMRQCV